MRFLGRLLIVIVTCLAAACSSGTASTPAHRSSTSDVAGHAAASASVSASDASVDQHRQFQSYVLATFGPAADPWVSHVVRVYPHAGAWWADFDVDRGDPLAARSFAVCMMLSGYELTVLPGHAMTGVSVQAADGSELAHREPPNGVCIRS